MLRYALFMFISIFCTFSLSAANADFMRSIGKIYVVVGVMLLLFLGIVFYLIQIDRRLTNFENQIKSDE
ncbi:MAG: CcmD family protein [Bacteroidetes bacterium]|nr:CcmD family protein [Bacteroidota bacterium]